MHHSFLTLGKKGASEDEEGTGGMQRRSQGNFRVARSRPLALSSSPSTTRPHAASERLLLSAPLLSFPRFPFSLDGTARCALVEAGAPAFP